MAGKPIVAAEDQDTAAPAPAAGQPDLSSLDTLAGIANTVAPDQVQSSLQQPTPFQQVVNAAQVNQSNASVPTRPGAADGGGIVPVGLGNSVDSTSTTTTSGKPVDLSGVQAASDQGAAATREYAKQKGIQDNVLGGAIQTGTSQLAQMEGDNDKRRAADDAKAAEFQAKMDRAHQEFDKVTVDPDRYWHDRSTGTRILAALSVGLGQIGAGMTGGKNMAAEIIDNAIKRDVEAQKLDLEKKGKSYDQLKGAYHLFLQETGNKDAAYSAAVLRYRQDLQLRLEGIAKSTNNPVVAAAAEAQIAENRTKLEETMAKLKMESQGTTSTTVASKNTASDVLPKFGKQKQDFENMNSAHATWNAQFNQLANAPIYANTAPQLVSQAARQSAATQEAYINTLARFVPEFKNKTKQEQLDGYVPLPSDSKETLALKRKNSLELMDSHKPDTELLATRLGAKPAFGWDAELNGYRKQDALKSKLKK